MNGRPSCLGIEIQVQAIKAIANAKLISITSIDSLQRMRRAELLARQDTALVALASSSARAIPAQLLLQQDYY